MPDKHFLYILGGPGSGKSTLAEALARGHPPILELNHPFYHSYLRDGVVELGRRRDGFSGTDTLSMAVQPRVVKWMNEIECPLILAEGDRLANEAFFRDAQKAGYHLKLVYLNTPPDIMADWRRERDDRLGRDPQNRQWVNGRCAKHRHLVESGKWDAVVIDDIDVERRVAMVRDHGSPVAQALRAI